MAGYYSRIEQNLCKTILITQEKVLFISAALPGP